MRSPPTVLSLEAGPKFAGGPIADGRPTNSQAEPISGGSRTPPTDSHHTLAGPHHRPVAGHRQGTPKAVAPVRASVPLLLPVGRVLATPPPPRPLTPGRHCGQTLQGSGADYLGGHQIFALASAQVRSGEPQINFGLVSSCLVVEVFGVVLSGLPRALPIRCCRRRTRHRGRKRRRSGRRRRRSRRSARPILWTVKMETVQRKRKLPKRAKRGKAERCVPPHTLRPNITPEVFFLRPKCKAGGLNLRVLVGILGGFWGKKAPTTFALDTS